MAEISTFWGGTVTGDAGPYTDDQFSDVMSKLFQLDRATQGPLKGVLNELEVTNPSGRTIEVDTGFGIVDGKFYLNNSVRSETLANPGALRYYRVVLRKDFVAQTVRIVITGPTESAPDALVQNDGTTWEVGLASFSISAGGVVSAITDEREFCRFATDLVVGTSEITNESITPAKILNRSRTLFVPFSHTYTNNPGHTNGIAIVTANWGVVMDKDYTTGVYGSFVVPEDYVSGGRVIAMYATHGNIEDEVVRLSMNVELAPRGSPGTYRDYDLDEATHVLPKINVNDELTIYEGVYVDTIHAVAGDSILVYSQRNGSSPSDIGTEAFGCLFRGFLFTYTADS